MVAGLRTMVKDGYLTKGKHDYNFKPAKTCTYAHQIMQSTYEYKENGPATRKKFRDKDGEVILEPIGFKTNPMKKGRTKSVVFEHYEY